MYIIQERLPLLVEYIDEKLIYKKEDDRKELVEWFRSLFKFLVRTVAWCMDKNDGDEMNLRIFTEPHFNSLYYRRKKDKGEFTPYDVVNPENKIKGLGQVKCCDIPVLSNRTQDIFDFSKKDEAEKLITRENFIAQIFKEILK